MESFNGNGLFELHVLPTPSPAPAAHETTNSTATTNDMTTYEKAFQQLSTEQQEILSKKMEEWKNSEGWKSERVVENFKDEHFLSPNQMRELMEFIISKKDAAFDSIKNEMRPLIYSKYQLQGDTIKQTKNPRIIGFALPEDIYIDTLMRLYGKDLFNLNNEEIKKFIINLANGICDPLCSECLFKDPFKLVWMTWDNKSNVHDPFCFMQYDSPDEVIVTLGLDPDNYTGKPLLLFSYNVPKQEDEDFQMYRPTFCDSDFYEHFKPTPLDIKDYGLTKPLEDVISVNGNSYQPERRPEAVVRSKGIKLDKVEKVIRLEKSII